MPFAPETQAILDRVQETTKVPIALSADLQSPHLLAQVKMARANSSAHFIQYQPNVPGVNYNLAFQCAFILRLHENPPSERFDFVGVEAGRGEVLRMMKGSLKSMPSRWRCLRERGCLRARIREK